MKLCLNTFAALSTRLVGIAFVLMIGVMLGIHLQPAPASAQEGSADSSFSPLLDLRKQVPMSLTLTIPGIDQSLVAPVTFEYSISLGMRYGFGPDFAEHVPMQEGTPDPAVLGVKDDLGIRYTVAIDSPDLTLSEWTAYRDQYDRFTIAGEVMLAKDAEPIADVLTTVRIYGHDNHLLDVTELTNVAYGLTPGRATRFDGWTQIDPNLIEYYSVRFKVIR